MTPRPTRDTPAGRAYNDLRNLARKQRRDVAEYLTLYTLEGFLARLALSTQVGDFVLKGGVLMAAFADRRPTRDIDLLGTGFANEITECERRVRDIATIPLDDGLAFEPSSVRGEFIRDEADYTGVRVHISAALASAQLDIHIDINFGDPIWPAPAETDLPRLLGGTVHLLGYPDHMVLAEKLVTAIQRGTANTRWRDFADVYAIARHRPVAQRDLRQSLATVALHRGGKSPPARPSPRRHGRSRPAPMGSLATQTTPRRHHTRAVPGPTRRSDPVRRPGPYRRTRESRVGSAEPKMVVTLLRGPE